MHFVLVPGPRVTGRGLVREGPHFTRQSAGPCHMPPRLPLIRERLVAWNGRAEAAPLVERGRARVGRRERGVEVAHCALLALFDDAEGAQAAGLALSAVHWPSMAAPDVT